MVELKVKDIPGVATYTFWTTQGPWMLTSRSIQFELFDYKINGVIYARHSPEFKLALEKEIMWSALQ